MFIIVHLSTLHFMCHASWYLQPFVEIFDLSFLNNFEATASLVPVLSEDAQVLAVEACREKRSGLSRAGHSRFWLAPMDPPEGTAEPLSQGGGTSVEKHLRKSKKHWRKRGGGNEAGVRNYGRSTMVRGEGGALW